MLFIRTFAFLMAICIAQVPSSTAQNNGTICNNLFIAGQYVSAAQCFLSLDPPHYQGARDSYAWAGHTARDKGDYIIAFNYYTKELEYALIVKDAQFIGYAYGHLGYCCYYVWKYTEAIDYLANAAKYFLY